MGPGPLAHAVSIRTPRAISSLRYSSICASSSGSFTTLGHAAPQEGVDSTLSLAEEAHQRRLPSGWRFQRGPGLSVAGKFDHLSVLKPLSFTESVLVWARPSGSHARFPRRSWGREKAFPTRFL